MSNRDQRRPKAFLCHCSDDKTFVTNLENVLFNSRIDTFYHPKHRILGQSDSKQIDNALVDCTHFIAILSPNCIDRGWVGAEIDAALDLQVRGKLKFLPVLYKLSRIEFNKLDRPLLCRIQPLEMDDELKNVEELVAFINGVHKELPGIHRERDPFTKLQYTGSIAFGRDNELNELNEAWTTGTCNIFSLIAAGGTGKTTLVNTWIKQLSGNNCRKPDRQF